MASKVILDDLFLLSELGSASLVSLAQRKRLAQETRAAIDLYAARGWLDDPRTYHRVPPPMGAFSLDEELSGVGLYQHLRFESDYRPHPDEPGRERWLSKKANKTAHAWLLEHPGEARPWIVCVPGYRMGHPLVDFTGFQTRWLHHGLGLNVAVPVLPLHGPRSLGRRSGDGFLSGDFVDTVHAQTQAVWDIRRMIAWLRKKGNPEVGLYGVSLGGYTAALLAAVEENLACVIAGVPATDFVALLRSHLPAVALSAAKRVSLSFEPLEQLLRVVSPLAISPRVPHERRFIYAGTVDSLVVPEQAKALWRHWQEPKLEWYEGSHVSFIWEAKVRALVRGALETGGLVARRAPEARPTVRRPSRQAVSSAVAPA